MTNKEYKTFLRKLPEGTIPAVAERRGVTNATIYWGVKHDLLDVVQMIIEEAKRINDEKLAHTEKIKSLTESL